MAAMLIGGRNDEVIETNDDGTTEVDAVVTRDGKNLRGRALGFVLALFGRRVLGKELAKTARAIERRSTQP